MDIGSGERRGGGGAVTRTIGHVRCLRSALTTPAPRFCNRPTPPPKSKFKQPLSSPPHPAARSLSTQIQAQALVYTIVAGMSAFVATSARSKERESFRLQYQQASPLDTPSPKASNFEDRPGFEVRLGRLLSRRSSRGWLKLLEIAPHLPNSPFSLTPRHPLPISLPLVYPSQHF